MLEALPEKYCRAQVTRVAPAPGLAPACGGRGLLRYPQPRIPDSPSSG